MANIFVSGLEIRPKLIWYGNCKNIHCIILHSNKGQMFMAMDPSVFVDDFPTRLNGLMSDLRNLDPVSFHTPYHILILELLCNHQLVLIILVYYDIILSFLLSSDRPQ